MLIGTMSPTQNFHTIAYGICSHEDTAAHEHVLHAVREAVNATVADRAAKKMRVCEHMFVYETFLSVRAVCTLCVSCVRAVCELCVSCV